MIWSQLPNQIPIHFNIADQADNFQPKPLVVFGLPILLLLVHLFVIFMIGRDPKNRMMNEKMVKVNHWLTPIVSLSISYLIYSKALGSTTNPSVFVSVLLGSSLWSWAITCLSWKWITRLESAYLGPCRVKITGTKPIALQGSCGSSEVWSFFLKQAFNSRCLMYWCWSSSPLSSFRSYILIN